MLLISTNVYAREARKVAVFFGGGGEAKSQKNNFDATFESFHQFATKRKWERNYFYSFENPSSQDLNKKIYDESKVKSLTFWQSAYEQKIMSLIQEMKPPNAKLKAGDQILIEFASHGTMDKGNFIVSAAEGESIMPLKQLEALKAAAEKAGVKLAVLGATCFSGQLQNLASDKTCVISTSRPDKFAAVEDGSWITEGLQILKNLEDAFLAGRESQNLLGQPMISSGPGKRASEALESFKGALRDPGNKDHPEFGYLSKLQCQEILTSLMAKAEMFQGVAIMGMTNPLKKATKLIQQVDQEQRNYFALMNQANICLSENKVTSCDSLGPDQGSCGQPAGVAKFCMRPPVPQTRLAELDKEISELKMAEAHFTKDAKSPTKIKFDALTEERRLLDKYKFTSEFKAASKRAKIATSEATRAEGRLTQNLIELNKFERDAFKQLYSKYEREEKGPNPCRDFKL